VSDPRAACIIAISRQIDALALERVRLLVGFDADRGYELDGCVNTVAWLKSHCRLSAAAALEVVGVARRLPSCLAWMPPWSRARSASSTPP
jgi:hypothetical protein